MNNEVELLEVEIEKVKKSLSKFNKRVPYHVLFGVLFSLLYPFKPGRRGRPSLIEKYDYLFAVLYSAVIYFVIYPIIYYYTTRHFEKKIKALESKKKNTTESRKIKKPYKKLFTAST